MDVNDLILMLGRHPLGGWLVVATVFLVLELLTMTNWLLWPAAAAAVTGFVSKVTTIGPSTEIAVWLGLTTIFAFTGRALTETGARGAKVTEEREERVVGLTGKAMTTFRSGSGRVYVAGREWAAEVEGKEKVRSGDHIYVVRQVGASRLKVKKHGHEPEVWTPPKPV